MEANLKKKFNLLDYAIILMIILGLFIGYKMVFKKKNIATDEIKANNIHVSFYAIDASKRYYKEFEKGDVAVDYTKKNKLGVVDQINCRFGILGCR